MSEATVFYGEMREIASELIDEFETGIVRLARQTVDTADGDRPWDITRGAPSYTSVPAIVLDRPNQKYVDGTRIKITDKQVTIPAKIAIVPKITDRCEINGVLHETAAMIAVPEADPVVYKFFVRV